MAKIFAPNKQYNGISAGIPFLMGVGETTDSYLIDWFKSKGYGVEEPEEIYDEVPEPEEPENEFNLDEWTVEELIKFAEVNQIDIGKATSKEGILKKIADAAEEIEE